MAKRRLVSEGGGGVFALPWVVARDEGLFDEVGVEVVFTGRQGGQQQRERFQADPKLVDTLVGHETFEEGGADLYRACEWGQIVRAHDSKRGGRIIGKRAAVATQAILVLPDSGITHPQDLRNKTIGVNFWSGSHYISIQLLEGFLEDDEINLVNIGGSNRLEALLNHEVDAVTVMEPWITIGEKLGALSVGEAHYVGSEIAGDDVDPETFELVNQAIRKAVKLINADKRKYVHYLIDDLEPKWKDLVTSEDFYLPRLRYVDPTPYPAGEFQKTFDWLVKWNLIDPDSGFEDIVDNRIAVAS